MNIINFNNKIKLIENYQSVFLSGPVESQVIQDAEKLLKMTFPLSYRNFLNIYGCLQIYERTIAGITENNPNIEEHGEVCWQTFQIRKMHSLPPGLIVIEYDEYIGICNCLDTNLMSSSQECPVVDFDTDNQVIIRKNHRCADNFEIYLNNFLDYALETFCDVDPNKTHLKLV